MDPAVREALGRARAARVQKRSQEVLEALNTAAHCARSPQDVQVAGWRLAKGIYDFGSPDALMDALVPVLATEAPFAHHPSAVSAAEPIARRVWDVLGYGDLRTQTLWRAYTDHHRAIGDPWLAAMGDVQRAWQLACLGRISAVRDLMDHYANLSPRRFGRGPTKHPEAWDTTLSLYWVQSDLARTLLRSATWTGNADEAQEALEVYRDALAASERATTRTWWYLDPACRAADRFGWTSNEWAPWSRGVAHLAEQYPVQAGIAQGVLHRRAARTEPALESFATAGRIAAETGAGWEWVADAWTESLRTSEDPQRRAKLADLIESRHLHAFRW